MSTRPYGITASMLNRIDLCPGSWRMAHGLPEPPANPDAAAGARIHAALAGQLDPTTLDAEETRTFEMCQRLRDEVVQESFGVSFAEFDGEIYLEKRFGTDYFSGQLDLAMTRHGAGLVVDYKTGREAHDAATDKQMLGCAVLLFEHAHCTRVHVAMIQPWVSGQVTLAAFHFLDLSRGQDWLAAALQAAYAPSAPVRASADACRFCRAKTSCPEALATMKSIQISTQVVQPATLTADALAMRLEQCAVVEGIVDAYRQEARRRLSQGDSVPGWELREGRRIPVIVDVQELYARCAGIGITHADFLGTITARITALRKLIPKQDWDHVTRGVIAHSRSAPTLAKL